MRTNSVSTPAPTRQSGRARLRPPAGSSCGRGPGSLYNRAVFPALLFVLYASIVNAVRVLIDRNDRAAAEAATRSYRAQLGQTPELAAAGSWLARANLAAKRYD